MIDLSRNERRNGKIFVIRRGDELIRVVARAGPDIYASALSSSRIFSSVSVSRRRSCSYSRAPSPAGLAAASLSTLSSHSRSALSPSSAAASSHSACLRRIRLTSAAVPACSYASRASAVCPLSSSSRATSSGSHPPACSRFSTWPSRMFRLVSFVSASAASSSVLIAVSHSSYAFVCGVSVVSGQLQPALDVVGEVVAGTRRVACPVDQAASQRLLHPRHGQIRPVAARRRRVQEPARGPNRVRHLGACGPGDVAVPAATSRPPRAAGRGGVVSGVARRPASAARRRR